MRCDTTRIKLKSRRDNNRRDVAAAAALTTMPAPVPEQIGNGLKFNNLLSCLWGDAGTAGG
jgi:hypothetical protein